MRAAEGDDTAYGQALYPVPADDPNDPLQVRFILQKTGREADSVEVAKLEENDDPDYCFVVFFSRKYLAGRAFSIYHYLQRGI